ncbi:hypothetical protein Clacol_000558 [Clathrus columnatus]|uniref:Glutaredoxin domain-containing protein n=1 Tax=Clathrus columnatus TaxID=1419009 RepID=A0AAV4ZYQ0_9AGAM|nr:hypothetical protein Clacol_000558 [Clathrus columnatus]
MSHSQHNNRLPFAATPRSLKGNLLFKRKRLYVVLAFVFGLFWLFTRWTTLSFDWSSKVQLGSAEEFDGLLYMVSHTAKVLPRDLNPDLPLEPSLWSTPRGRWSTALKKKEIKEALRETPVIVFSKTYCPYSRAVKDLLKSYDLSPPPKIIEVDIRDDGDVLKRLLYRLTNHNTFPNVIIGGKSVGGSDDVRRLHEKGDLKDMFLKINVNVGGDITAIN